MIFTESLPNFSANDNDCLDNHSSFDILLGRDKAMFNHSGNKRFRAIVSHNVYKYSTATRKSSKTALVKRVYAEMKDAGFQFLKKEGSLWKPLGDTEAKDKLSHALRDRLRELRRPSRRPGRNSKSRISLMNSMASIIRVNQLLLQSSSSILLAPQDLPEQKTKSSGMFENQVHCQPAMLENITGSLQNILTRQFSKAKGNKKGRCSGSNLEQASQGESAAYLCASPGLLDRRNLQEEDVSDAESLFGGQADEIADTDIQFFDIPSSKQTLRELFVEDTTSILLEERLSNMHTA